MRGTALILFIPAIVLKIPVKRTSSSGKFGCETSVAVLYNFCDADVVIAAHGPLQKGGYIYPIGNCSGLT